MSLHFVVCLHLNTQSILTKIKNLCCIRLIFWWFLWQVLFIKICLPPFYYIQQIQFLQLQHTIISKKLKIQIALHASFLDRIQSKMHVFFSYVNFLGINYKSDISSWHFYTGVIHKWIKCIPRLWYTGQNSIVSRGLPKSEILLKLLLFVQLPCFVFCAQQYGQISHR